MSEPENEPVIVARPLKPPNHSYRDRARSYWLRDVRFEFGTVFSGWRGLTWRDDDGMVGQRL